MNKHNSKAVAILACLLSYGSIASAHPQEATMIGGGSYDQ